MRLRLIIERNQLPSTFLAWSTPQNCSAAQLLVHVNNVIPLESGQWTLEDYVVEVPGPREITFEVLHFDNLEHVLSDESEVL